MLVNRVLCSSVAMVVGALGSICTFVACADEGITSANGVPESGDAGTVSIALTLGNTSIGKMHYVIDNAAHSYKGEIALTGASLLASVVGGIEAGDGYRLTLTGATDGDAGFTCTGTAGPFIVPARSTASVSIAIRCKRPSNVGAVMVGGTINLCPSIDTIVADPAVNGTIALHGTAEDVDGLPQPLAYAWTASPGSLSTPNQADATLRCTQSGQVNVQLSVTDGDPECVDSLSLQVTCPSVAVASAATVSSTRDAGAEASARTEDAAPSADALPRAVDASAAVKDAGASAANDANAQDATAVDARDSAPLACAQSLPPVAERGAVLCSGCAMGLLPPRRNADGSCPAAADAGAAVDECGCNGKSCEAGTCSLQYVGLAGNPPSAQYRNACLVPVCAGDEDCGRGQVCIPALGIAGHTAPKCVPAACITASDCSETGCVSCNLVVSTTEQGETTISGAACATR